MAIAASFVAIVFLASLVLAQVPNCARNYTVAAGDFCDRISAQQSVSTFQLAHVNVDTIDPACDNLFIGESLCLGIVGQDCNITTVVQSGDSCPVIATRAGITTTLLKHNNPNIDGICGNIYPGEVLCTSTSSFDYT